MNMLEKAAQIIAKELASTANYAFTASDNSDCGWEGEMDQARDVAKRVLLAIRARKFTQPVFAGFFQDGDGLEDNHYIDAYEANYAWRAMIDAILSEGVE